MANLTSIEVTNEKIEALAVEAAEAGDTTLVRACKRALRGDTASFAIVLRALQDAAAMAD
jgi:hypothetical protein